MRKKMKREKRKEKIKRNKNEFIFICFLSFNFAGLFYKDDEGTKIRTDDSELPHQPREAYVDSPTRMLKLNSYLSL